MEDVLARHRKQTKELQAKITAKKKQATKKTRKGVNDECDRLEQELKDKQAAEIADLNDDSKEEHDDGVSNHQDQVNGQLASLSLQETSGAQKVVQSPKSATSSTQSQASSHIGTNGHLQERRVPRARARLERRKAEQEAMFNQAATEASNLPDLKAQERERMVANFKSRGLIEHEIRADGHCLYSAFADQMNELHLPLEDKAPGDQAKVSILKRLSGRRSEEEQRARFEGYKVVRREAAGYMEAHADDFAPFLEEDLDTYVQKIRETAEWGGQMELTALARRYGVQINVLQGDGRVEEIKPGDVSRTDKVLWLAYYRHGFGLGEHYNSLRPAG